MPNDIDQKIETWKNKLLDLSNRNRLLNYRETKRSTLKLLSPDYVLLWNHFVKEEQEIKFPYYDEYSKESRENSPVKTEQTGEDMQKTLRNLRDKTRIAQEEQGTHILYLSFGFLKWTEKIDSDTVFHAPIVLVPVHLKIESIASPYTLSLHEDEIVVNPTLCYKLKNDFSFNLPVTIDKNDDIQDYFEEVRKCIANCKGWEVRFEVSLCLLSFLKIHMYHDLSKNKEAIKQNSIIKAINGDSSSLSVIPDEIKDFDYDRQLHPSQTFQVVDADSSQQDAILYAKRGVSFILQGPPGTGKSQTITNIISECLADGKKVLFVAEKMAALEVVHKRLSDAELHEFCLILHSHKASKKDILNQLDKVLEMRRNRISMRDEAYERLDTLQKKRDELNDYVHQLHTKIQPLGFSLFTANGELAKLESYNSITFDIQGIAVENVNRETYNNWLYLLKRLADTAGKMSTDSFHSPWRGTTLDSISHELRHNINEKLPVLISQIKEASETLQGIYSVLSLKWERNSVLGLRKLIPIFEVAKQSPIVPSSWIFIDDISPLVDEISKYEKLQNDFLLNRKELKVQCSIILTHDPSINRLDVSGLNHTDDIKEVLFHIQSHLKHPPYAKWDSTDQRLFSLFKEVEEQSRKLNELLSSISLTCDNGIFDIDYASIYNRYKTKYTSFLKVFKKSYKNDRNTVLVHYKTIVKRVSDKMILDTVIKLCTIITIKKWFERNQQELQNYFGNLYAAEKTDFSVLAPQMNAYRALLTAIPLLNNMYSIATSFEQQRDHLASQYQQFYQGLVVTDWGKVRERLIWAINFREFVQKTNLNADFVKAICSRPELSAKCGQFIQKTLSIIERFNVNEGAWFLSLFIQEEKESILSLAFPTLHDRLEKCMCLSLLEEWIDFKNVREECRRTGLANYIRQMDNFHIDNDAIVPIFKKQFFKSWIDKVSPRYPAVCSFRRRNYENTIQEFSKLDKEQFIIARAAVKCKLIEKLPDIEFSTNGRDELGILKHELNKQRRIMPIRKLFKEIPTLLPTLKPCFMMSPFSVSLFLEADSYLFDTVIFDEASQICTENAIGAIFRGKQVIIAGDRYQLPPTKFFANASPDSDYDGDDEEPDDTNDHESILDEAHALPERTLLWHYRSRHEHLIAFSNEKIYKRKLITFPSNIDRSPDNGVEYIFVKEGFYNRGGKKGNVPEAEKVTKLVFEHFHKYPKRSLGVIAFGEVQQQAIEIALRAKRRNAQYSCYESFFDEERDESFFIKNLENVQGDERDTIIFSIGYAKSEEGVFYMNFGPLSKPGGERRLNVAITRAKFNVKLVGSIQPTDIDLERISNDGPKLLREYIAFAQRGVKALTKEVTTTDSIQWDSFFEESVYHFLNHREYKLKTQVGCSGYRIDIAVEHPTLSGVYVLGIECDGATYHSSRTARERDRLRQDVLERMGWKIYRIWSTDWIKDVTTEGERLVSAINEAIFTYGKVGASMLKGKAVPTSNDFIARFSPLPRTESQEGEQIQRDLFEEHKKLDVMTLLQNNPRRLSLADCIRRVIDNEYPLHYDRLCQKVSPILGKKNVTDVTRREVDAILKKIRRDIFRKGDFLFPSKEAKIIPRIPTDRKINHISTEEIATAMETILTHCIGGISKDDLCTETVRLYGFRRSGVNISSAMEEAFCLLIQNGSARMVGDKVIAVTT